MTVLVKPGQLYAGDPRLETKDDPRFPNVKFTGLRIDQKAVQADKRTFAGLASVWDPDLVDDIIEPGAFKKTIADWKRSATRLKLLDTHNYFTIRAALGWNLQLKEVEDGLWSEWQVMEGQDGDAAMERIRQLLVDAMSIGFEPVRFSFREDDSARWGVIRILHEIRLKEVSLVLFPAAPGALIDASTVKSLMAGGKATPEDIAVLRHLHQDLGQLLDSAPDPSGQKATEIGRAHV